VPANYAEGKFHERADKGSGMVFLSTPRAGWGEEEEEEEEGG